ncbi:MAG: ATP-binding protein [bacterium]|nr:ATP-binding protein [bacterium]
MSREHEIGIIVGSTTTSRFTFVINSAASTKPRLGDIVKTYNIDNETIYGIITDIHIRAPDPLELGKDYSTIAYFAEKLGYTNMLELAEVRILGARSAQNPRLHRPSFPPRPNSKVYFPSREEAEQIYSIQARHSITIGKIRHLELAPQLRLLDIIIKHLAIFGITGAGKSHTVAVLCSRLAEHGVPVVLFDVHRDYVQTFENSLIVTFDEREQALLRKHCKEVLLAKLSLEKIKHELPALLGVEYRHARMHYFLLKVLKELEGQMITVEQLLKKLEREYELANSRDKESLSALIKRLERLMDSKLFLHEGETCCLLTDLLEFTEPEQAADEEVVNANLPEEFRNITSFVGGILQPGKIVVLDLFPLTHIEQQMVIYITLSTIFSRCKEHKKRGKPFPVVCVVEEAHRFASSHSLSEEIMSTIAREGRKFGMGLWIVSQMPSKLSEEVVSQVNTFILHRLINPKDLAFVRAACPYLSEEYFTALAQLERGEAVVVGLGIEQPAIIKIEEQVYGRPVRIGGGEEELERRIEELKKTIR